MPLRPSAASRSLPAKPSLVQLRKQAKDLLKRYRAGQPDAVSEVEQFERQPDPASFVLADAQRVLARAYGFPSWTKLSHHVDGLTVEQFYKAVDSGDIASVQKIVKACPDIVNAQATEVDAVALYRAVVNRDGQMIRALMELGCDARKGCWPHREATTAHKIATEREYDEIVNVIEQEEGRRLKSLSASDATINTSTDEVAKAIQEQRRDDAIRILEDDPSLIGAGNSQGATPLHLAAWAHDPVMVGWLLDHDASVNVTDVKGKTPLDYAAIVAGWSANDSFFPFLENAHVDPARFNETVSLLRSKGAALTPRAAVASGDEQAVLKLHRAGRLKNDIHIYRGGLLSIAVRVNREEMVSLLLRLGFDPDEPAVTGDDDRSWGMPLWFAAVCGRHAIAELLLAGGADVNAIVYACGDALCSADATGDERMKQLLVEHGARLTVEAVASRKDRETAHAILEGKVAAQSLNIEEPSHEDLAEQMLWAAGDSDAEIVRMCLPHITRKPEDPWWCSVLMRATLPGSLKHVLDHEVDPDAVGEGGFTALHHFAAIDIDEPLRLRLVEILLDAGASLLPRDAMLESTPLGWACRWGRVELVELYLANGVDAVEPTAESWATPISWATKRGHDDIAELLRSRIAN